jgi:hypothetical protein
MDSIGDTAAPYLGPSENMQGYAGLAFAAFVLRHGGCRGELIESRLGEDLLACWCPQCDEMRTFGATAPSTYSELQKD